jgi:hypothetical protein
MSYRTCMKKNTYRRKFKIAYVFVLESIAIAIGEVGINGSRSSPGL